MDGLYYRRVFRGSEVADCAIMKKMRLITWKLVSCKLPAGS